MNGNAKEPTEADDVSDKVLSAETLSLGGTDGEIGYHPLALDAEDGGGWNWVDRCSRRVGEWFNPILIKEARQSLKSRQFIITFFLLLAASCIWTVLGVVANAPDVYYVPTGNSLLMGYYFVLAIPLIGMVPLAAHRSLAAEIDDDTFEMLIITRLSSIRIVTGKLNSAMLQMLVYFAAIVPCLAFTYLLRGVDLPTIVMLIVIIFLTALLVTTLALMLATAAPHRAGQTLALLATLVVIVFAEFMCGVFCMEAVLDDNMGGDIEAILFTSLFAVVGGSCMLLFTKAAAARIAPVTENRSSGLRWCMFAQQLIWIGTIALVALWYEDLEVVNFGMMVVGGYWLLMGSLMLSESPELSPRVQRSLPQTYAGRMFLLWFNPGPGTGFVFAISSGMVATAGLAVFGTFVSAERSPRTDPITFSMIMIGYLMGYLGVVRLIAMPLCHRFGRWLSISAGTLAAVMGLGLVLPTILTVLTTGATPNRYRSIEAIDWGWTLVEAFDSRYSPMLAFTILSVGAAIALINLTLLLREFDYRRIAVPKRVLEDRIAE